MKDIYKSALWATISIPITLFGVNAGFAIAHGALPPMLILLAPGLMVLWAGGEYNWPEWLMILVGFSAQYFTYLIIIHGIRKIIHRFKPNKNNNNVKGISIDKENYIPIQEFSIIKEIEEDKVIDMIKDGFYIGRLIDNNWYVHKTEL